MVTLKDLTHKLTTLYSKINSTIESTAQEVLQMNEQLCIVTNYNFKRDQRALTAIFDYKNVDCRAHLLVNLIL